MRKYLFLLIGLSLNIFCYGQKAIVDAQAITNSDDTIQFRLRVKKNIFYKNTILPVSVYKRLVVVDSSGKKSDVLWASDLKKMEIINLKGKKEYYIRNHNQFRQVLYDGRIKWYRNFYYEFKSHTVQSVDNLVDENGEGYLLSEFNHRKNQVMRVIASKPELVRELEDKRFKDIDLLEVLKRFDEEGVECRYTD